MGFFDAMKKMAQGKPLFEVPTDENGQDLSPNDHNDPNADYKKDLPPEDPGVRSLEPSRRYDEHGQKVLPRLEMIYCRCKKSDKTVQVWATIRNQSDVNVFLDKVTMCGSAVQFDYPLAPGQQHDFMIYDGNSPSSPADCYSDVFYKDRGTGDYFAVQHMIIFKDDQNGTFSPLSFKPLLARDV